MSLVSALKNDFVVGGKYRLIRRIGSGSFGDIYLGINISNGEVTMVFYYLKCIIYSLYALICIFGCFLSIANRPKTHTIALRFVRKSVYVEPAICFRQMFDSHFDF